MRKITVITVLAIAAILLSTAVVNADQPPGVAPAQKILSPGTCGVSTSTSDYEGSYYWQLSNGAQGRALFRCHLSLIKGPGDYTTWTSNGWPNDTCKGTVTVEGETAQWMVQCAQLWAVP